MAKSKKKKMVKRKKAAAMMAVAAPAKFSPEVIQAAYDDELKSAVKTYIQNTIDLPAVHKDPKEAETIFLTSLKRIRDTQARVLEMIEGQ